MNARSIVSSAVTLLAVLSSGAAFAQLSPPELRAQRAQAALSERYAQLYASMPEAERRQFASSERRWLNGGRWHEQRTCLLANAPDLHGASGSVVADVAAADAAAHCLALVIEARLQSLAPARLAAMR
jgi:hypothetical protein